MNRPAAARSFPTRVSATPIAPRPRPGRGLLLSTQLVLGVPLLLLFVVLTSYLAVSSAEPMLTFASMLVLLVGAKLLWRVGEPPILFAAFFLQWMQVSLLVIQAAVAGVPLTDYY